MQRPRGGSLFLLLTSDELVARLATLVPPPRIHSVRYHGVFAPNCKVRERVVPPPQVATASTLPPASPAAPVPSGAASGPHCKPARTPGPYRVPWADLLRKVFAVDVLACTSCGGRLQVIAFTAEALVAARILDHLGLDSCGPPLTRVQAPPELFDPGPSYDAPDSPYPA